jgi:hypothetical protein
MWVDDGRRRRLTATIGMLNATLNEPAVTRERFEWHMHKASGDDGRSPATRQPAFAARHGGPWYPASYTEHPVGGPGIASAFLLPFGRGIRFLGMPPGDP